MAIIKHQKTKTLITKQNNNSSDCIAPNIIYGCFGNCIDTYCYMSRYNGKRVFVNKNVDQIFNSVVEWEKTYKKIPNQQDPVYTMVDIACNSDLVLMQKHVPGTLHNYLKSDILEPKMQKILSRIKDVNRLKKLGWEVHLNYSPLIFYPGWSIEYENLFKFVKKYAGENKCEVIALTNHVFQMNKASEEARELMKYSDEPKNLSGTLRYPIKKKTRALENFKNIYSKYFKLETIRYIF